VFAAPGAFAAPAPPVASDPDVVYTDLVNSIMSPVCPGKILQACPSAEGVQLRELVRRKADAGESREQIVRYFVEVYGPEVMPTPPAEGFYLTAWGLPFAGLLAGLGVVFVLVRAWSASAAQKREEEISTVAGGPGGASPGADDPLKERLRREFEEFDG
jgi:cytochrome c-type biogenesis protein CcmH/NrfF